jgi:hypothetical protein
MEFTMTEKPKKLSDTARALLTAAAARDDHLIRPPELPAAAARQVVQSLLCQVVVGPVCGQIHQIIDPAVNMLDGRGKPPRRQI